VQYLLYLALMPAYLAKQWIKKALGRTTDQQTWREKMQAMFDMFSPLYQHRNTPEEAVQWFRQKGCTEVQVSYQEEYGFGVRGNRTSLPQRLGVRSEVARLSWTGIWRS
jgi:hypothetical protein